MQIDGITDRARAQSAARHENFRQVIKMKRSNARTVFEEFLTPQIAHHLELCVFTEFEIDSTVATSSFGYVERVSELKTTLQNDPQLVDKVNQKLILPQNLCKMVLPPLPHPNPNTISEKSTTGAYHEPFPDTSNSRKSKRKSVNVTNMNQSPYPDQVEGFQEETKRESTKAIKKRSENGLKKENCFMLQISDDTVTISGCLSEIAVPVCATLKTNRRSGIQKTYVDVAGKVYTIKLRGYPFRAGKHTNLILVTAMLNCLFELGFILTAIDNDHQNKRPRFYYFMQWFLKTIEKMHLGCYNFGLVGVFHVSGPINSRQVPEFCARLAYST